MIKKLTGFVAVHDKDGKAHMFGPDDEVPKWAAEKITNPAAWQDGKAPAAAAPAAPAKEPAKDAPAATGKPEEAAATSGTEGTGADGSADDEGTDGDGSSDDEGTSGDAGATDDTTEQATAGGSEHLEIPPRGGPNATVDAWTKYAVASGFEIEGEPTRKEIIAALDAAGVATK